MGRRYYCDYCEKTFIDDIDARKKHLQSSQHIKMRNLHYENVRDPETILHEELLKTPCKRFEQYGSCQYEGNCKYTHYTAEELCQIRFEVEYKNSQLNAPPVTPEVPSLESWLEKYTDYNQKDNDFLQTSWTYSDQFEMRSDLPPSLRRLRPEHFYDDHFDEWGQ